MYTVNNSGRRETVMILSDADWTLSVLYRAAVPSGTAFYTE